MPPILPNPRVAASPPRTSPFPPRRRDTSQFAFVTERLAEWKVVLGGGAMIAPKFEGSDEFDVTPVPFVTATFGERVKVDPRGVSVNLYSIDGLSFSGQLGYDLGRSEDDSDHLKGLGDIDAGAVIGARVAYELGPVEFSTSINRTIGGSDGLEARFGADVSFEIRAFPLHYGRVGDMGGRQLHARPISV